MERHKTLTVIIRKQRISFFLKRSELTTPVGFEFELFCFHSPLLTESLLISFLPLNNMLKFSGFSNIFQAKIHGTEKHLFNKKMQKLQAILTKF